MSLTGKKLILGVTGSIAAYKAIYLVRRLIEKGAQVTVVMTRGATEFVTPLPFQVFSGKKVHIQMFNPEEGHEISHLYHSRWADAIIVAPATANIIGKMASGIGDDLLSSILLAATSPVVMAPAMDEEMYNNPIVQKNISVLEKMGVHFIGPVEGSLASGVTGIGRMIEPDEIVTYMEDLLYENKDLEDLVVIVTAGPTREPLDPVRYISNRSSGKMGYAIAQVAQKRGARVILISGPVSLKPPPGVECIRVNTTEEMLQAVVDRLLEAHVLIMAAAVADFRPETYKSYKLKKEEIKGIQLIPNPDILQEARKIKDNMLIVGFAAETGDLLTKAKEKLYNKRLDLIVANDISLPGSGFEVDTNKVSILDRSGNIKEYPLMDKVDVAEKVLDHIREFIKGEK